MAGSIDIVEASLLPPDGEPPPPVPRVRRPPVVAVLAVALAVALAALAVLGVQAYLRGQHEDGQAEALALVDRYTDALDRHDLAALHEELAGSAYFAAGEHLRWPVAGPYSGDELDAFYRRLFNSGVRIETTGPVTVTGSGAGPYQVTAVQTVSYMAEGVPVTEQAVSLYMVVTDDHPATLREHLWWRPLHSPRPSMAWAR